MTAQEAYAELISIRKNREDGYLTYLSYGGKADEQEEYTIKAYSVAIEALEKQIPRKCRIKSTAKLQTFYCPTCEQVIVSRIENEWLAGRLQKYCDSCGQALDWSDNND